MREVKKYVEVVDSVLDIGAGIRPQELIKPLLHICIEPHREYVQKLRECVGNDPRYLLLNCTWDTVMKFLPDKSVDSVFAIDVIEHLEKDAGYELLRESERIARRQVVIFTPLGFYPQSYEGPGKADRWGMDGGFWQTHRSGWHPEDFSGDWHLLCCESFHTLDQNGKRLNKPFGAIWGILNTNSTEGYSDVARKRIHSYNMILWMMLKRCLLPGIRNTANVLRGSNKMSLKRANEQENGS